MRLGLLFVCIGLAILYCVIIVVAFVVRNK